MRAFIKEFDPTRGDLVYGRTTVRDEYEKKHVTPAQLDAMRNGAWVRIDDYNNNSVLYALQHNADPAQLQTESHDAATDFASRNQAPARLPGYSNALFGSNKYSPSGAVGASDAKLGREQSYSKTANIEFLVIRRACKFGLDYVVKVLGNACVHFAIDDINMADIVKKTMFDGENRTQPAVPITTSELRSLYRKWHDPDYSQHVIFYTQGKEVAPPWLDSPAMWTDYGKTRFRKYADRLAKVIKDYELTASKKDAKSSQEKYAKAQKNYLALIKQDKYNEAVDHIRRFAEQEYHKTL